MKTLKTANYFTVWLVGLSVPVIWYFSHSSRTSNWDATSESMKATRSFREF